MKKKFLYFLFTLIITSIFAFSLNDSQVVLANPTIEIFNKDNAYDLITKETTPLILDDEKITFNVNIDDKMVYEKVSDYKNNLKIDYRFFNDTNADIEATFYQCMRKPSSVEFKYFDENKKDFVYLDDKELYSIPINGTYRYVYDLNKANNKLVSSIRDSYIYSDFLNNETPIYKYTFKVESADAKYVTYDFKDVYGSDVYSQFFGYNNFSYSFSTYTCYFNVLEDNTFVVYFINDLSDSFLNTCKVYDNKSNILNNISILKKETQKFEDFVFKYYDEEKGVSKLDYNNAIYDKINERNGIYNDIGFFNIYDSLVCFYEFNVTVSKNGFNIFSITRPVYPQISKFYSPSIVHSYNFNFNNLSFKEIQSRSIKIKTNSFIINSGFEDINDDEFIKIDSKMDVISFNISNDPNPVSDFNRFFDSIFIIAIVASIFFFGIMPIFLIGMIVALVAICANGRRTFINLDSSFKKLKTFYVLEGVLEILIFAQCIIQLVLTSLDYIQLFLTNLAYVQIALTISILIFTLIEIIKYNQKHIAKLVISIILLILTILDIFIIQLCLVALAITFALFIITLVCIDKYKKDYCDKNEINKEKAIKEKHYPLNILNGKEDVISKVGLIVAIILAILLSFALKDSDFALLLGILIAFILYFILHLIMQIHNQKAFMEFNNDLDYIKLKHKIKNILANKKINLETAASYKLLLAEKALCFSLEDFKELYDSININNEKIKREKDFILLNYLLSKEEFAKKASELKLKHKKYAKKIDRFTKKWNIMYLSIKDDNVIKQLPYNTKNNLLNAVNVFILINYYRNINGIDKANELYALFKEKYSCLVLLNELLDGVDVRLRYKQMINNEKVKCENCSAIVDKYLLECPYCKSKIEK